MQSTKLPTTQSSSEESKTSKAQGLEKSTSSIHNPLNKTDTVSKQPKDRPSRFSVVKISSTKPIESSDHSTLPKNSHCLIPRGLKINLTQRSIILHLIARIHGTATKQISLNEKKRNRPSFNHFRHMCRPALKHVTVINLTHKLQYIRINEVGLFVHKLSSIRAFSYKRNYEALALNIERCQIAHRLSKVNANINSFLVNGAGYQCLDSYNYMYKFTHKIHDTNIEISLDRYKIPDSSS